MERAIPGPHHCVALGMSETINVFRFIRDYSTKNGGCIEGALIDAIMEAYMRGMYEKIDRYYESNARCYGSVNSPALAFNKRRLTHFLLTEHLREMLERSFTSQTRDASKNWASFFVHALMSYASQKLEIDLAKDVGKRYNVLSFLLLHELTVEKCVADEEMRGIFKGFAKTFSPILKSEKLLDDLTFFVNREMDERFKTFGPNRMHVTNLEMRGFFVRMTT